MNDQENKPQEDLTPKPPYFDEKAQEKYEKEDEKNREKQDRDPLSNLAWALILIWAGLVFLASNLGWLDQFQPVLPEGFEFLGWTNWSLIFLGAGVIVFIEALIRMIVPAYRSSTGGSFFLAAIFLGIGLSGLFGWELVWPFVLIALGLSTLASALFRSRK